ncbi:MAG: hypothetical protein R6W75_02700, partial [Smithellaceae bacterium]
MPSCRAGSADTSLDLRLTHAVTLPLPDRRLLRKTGRVYHSRRSSLLVLLDQGTDSGVFALAFYPVHVTVGNLDKVLRGLGIPG